MAYGVLAGMIAEAVDERDRAKEERDNTIERLRSGCSN